VVLCTIKKISGELRNCFELISPQRTYILQASTEDEVEDWIHVTQNAIEYQLAQQQVNVGQTSHRRGLSRGSLKKLESKQQQLLQDMKRLNPLCADCGQRGMSLSCTPSRLLQF